MPPEATYESREALQTAINEWAAARGYAFSIGRSTKRANGAVVITFRCDRANKPPAAGAARKRSTSSRGTGCPFSVIGKESGDRRSWALAHRPDARHAAHNHPPSAHRSAHPGYRQLSHLERAIITSLVWAGTKPRDIRAYLCAHFDTPATKQDIYNRIAESKRQIGVRRRPGPVAAQARRPATDEGGRQLESMLRLGPGKNNIYSSQQPQQQQQHQQQADHPEEGEHGQLGSVLQLCADDQGCPPSPLSA
ncbi:hypothetical protein CDD83_3843 [Cordyceps sp. RAO-2017]|nr:hypothetical protein CDD83_3843 [Cordyceps sp. RAO-2017]